MADAEILHAGEWDVKAGGGYSRPNDPVEVEMGRGGGDQKRGRPLFSTALAQTRRAVELRRQRHPDEAGFAFES